ncbi:MAG: glutathione S-transferase family protein [Candidatus Eremiobacteraeota bacterium]|nr:glutathione S-transferase family protein [Candidatus Eremiobacteraeota bacterium]
MMKLWYAAQPASTRIARLMCYEMEVEVEECLVDLENENHRQSLLAIGINKLPALQIQEAPGYFSLLPDIAEYLGTLVSPERRLIPWDSEGGFEVRRWIYYVGNLVGTPIGLLELREEDSDCRKLLSGSLPALEARLTDQEYMAGDRFSLADCALGVYLAAYRAKAKWESEYPQLAAYLRRFQLRTAVRRL